MARVLLALTAGAMDLIVTGAPPVMAQRSPENVADLLNRYAKGERTVLERLTLDGAEIVRQLNQLAPRFLVSPDLGPDRARRVFTAFALEAAATAFLSSDLVNARKLVEIGCDVIRRGPPEIGSLGRAGVRPVTANAPDDDAFDRRWSLASIGLLTATFDPDFLETHVAHLRLRLPDEPRLRLAIAVAREQWTSPVAPLRLNDMAMTSTAASNTARVEADRERKIDNAIDRFRSLLGDTDLAGEAHVRLAHLHLDRGKPEESLEWLRPIDQLTTDPELRYLAHLFRGQAFERLNRTSEATVEYRTALKYGPGIHSATVSLATMLYRAGDRMEADRLVGGVMQDRNRRGDPWWTYWMGDMRLFWRQLSGLRELLG